MQYLIERARRIPQERGYIQLILFVRDYLEFKYPDGLIYGERMPGKEFPKFVEMARIACLRSSRTYLYFGKRCGRQSAIVRSGRLS